MGQIDKKETIERIRAKMNSGQWSDAVIFGMGKAISIIEAMQEKPHGEWIIENGKRYCSNCKKKAIYVPSMYSPRAWLTDFCPWCGADMREGDAE